MSGKDSDQMRAFLRALGHEIRSQRQLRKLSREALAEEAGISPSTMGRIERDGPVDVGDTWRIAEVLGISFPDMVRRAEDNGRRLYAEEFDAKADLYNRVSEMTDPDVVRFDRGSGKTTAAMLSAELDVDEPASSRPTPEEVEAQRAVDRLDRHVRDTRPTRKRAMQQMQNEAARDEDRRGGGKGRS